MAIYKQVSYGSQGSDVTELQKLLNQNGYNLSTDGIYGAKTQAAVKDYQSKNGLAVDGIVGNNTWGALTKAQSGSQAASTPATTTPAQTQPSTPTFEYADYKPSDTVAQAEALLQQQLAQKPGEYQSTWEGQLNDMIQQILNRDKFSYDLNGDALYQQYRDQYVNQGKLASMDVMGQAAAMTGGYGNSYAQAAGQQAYQAYLQQLNEVVPELYGMALDQYNQEGQALYDQAALMAQMEDQDYGRYRDQLSDYYAELDRRTEDARYQSETDYGRWSDDRNFSYGQFTDDRNYQYQQDRDAIADQQWQKQFDEAQRQYEEQMALTREQWAWEQSRAAASGGGGGGGNGDSSSENTSGATYADTLWTSTGTYDDNGNLIFRNSEGKTQAFAPGINPYTGTKHADAKNGTFSNGYQPNNIGGTKLKNSGMSTTITGKSQTIWQANGKYWLWRGDLNKYIEVDISDID